jgi:TIR domain
MIGVWIAVAVAAGLAFSGLGYAIVQLTTKSSRPNALFISFRPEDEPDFAGCLCDRLTENFGARNVFADARLLASGTDVDVILSKSLSQCRTLIVVIGKRWIGALDEHEHRRIADPADYVHREVAAALQRRLRIVPILVDGVDLPDTHSLPEALQPLTRHNAVKMSHADFTSEVESLVRALKRFVI